MKVKLFTSLTFVLLVMFLLSACATGNPSDSKGGSSKSDNSGKKDLTVAFDENIQTLDPHDETSGNDISVANSMYESLYIPDQDGELQPLLAKDYQKSDDGLDYTFELRDGVKFVDGEEFNAKAVKQNLERILDSKGSLNNFKSLRDVKKVDVTDDDDVKVTLKEPDSQFLEKLGNVRMISPKAIDDDDWDYGKKSAGTGQYELKKWTHGESIVVEKNKDYWDKGHPKMNKITFKPVPEDGSRIAALKTGEADLVYPIPVNDIDDLKKKDDLAVDVQESTFVNYATINTSKKPFNDKKVRQAMNYAINQDQYVKVVKNGYAKKSDSILPSTNVNYAKQTPYKYDLDKAKKLLKEAGYEDGFKTEIWGSDSSKDKLGMQFIQQELKKIGIDVDVKQMERGTLSDQINKPKTKEDSKVQMWYVSWSSTVGNTDNAINPLFSSTSFPPEGSNTAYYDNEKVDNLINDALHAKDKKTAKDKYADVQKIIFDDAPWLFTGVDEEATARNKQLKGAWRSADGNFYIQDAEWK